MHTDTCLTHGPHNTQTLIIHIFQCKQSSECILVHRCQGILPTTALSCTAPLTVREGAVPVDGVPPEDEAARAAATSASRRPLCCFALAAARSASPSAADTCMKPGGTHGAHGVAHAGPSVALRSLPPARPRPMQPTPAWRGGHMGRYMQRGQYMLNIGESCMACIERDGKASRITQATQPASAPPSPP